METDRRKANRIRREMNHTVSKLRNFDRHMEERRKALQKKYQEFLNELEKVT